VNGIVRTRSVKLARLVRLIVLPSSVTRTLRSPCARTRTRTENFVTTQRPRRSWVSTVTVGGPITSVLSFASLHAPATALLFASPL
jgi:hypothetical protein